MLIRRSALTTALDRPRYGGSFLAVALLGLIGLVVLWRELRTRVDGLSHVSLPSAGETTLILGLVILGSWMAGRLVRRVGLPPISGQLFFGVLVGPGLWAAIQRPDFALLTASQLASLKGPESLAVVMIGLVAGAEIDWKFLRSRMHTVIGIALGATLPVWLAAGFLAFMWLGSLPQAILIATISATSSTAVSVALLREMRHPTDFARLILAITVAKDLFLVVAFSVALFFVATTIDPTRQHWYGIVLHLAGSIAIGVALAYPLRWALVKVERRMVAVVLLAAIFLAILCQTIGIAPLITAVALGFAARNSAPEATASFFATARRLFLAVCCVFFASAGAHLDLAALAANWGVVFAISGVRALGLFVGGTVSARLARIPRTATRWMWAGLLPQAGISLALAAQLLIEFPDQAWAKRLATVAIACITLNELIGPIIARIALRRVPSDGLEKSKLHTRT